MADAKFSRERYIAIFETIYPRADQTIGFWLQYLKQFNSVQWLILNRIIRVRILEAVRQSANKWSMGFEKCYQQTIRFLNHI